MSGHTVEVSARKVNVPCFCPCCSGVADTELSVSCKRVTGERFMRETTRELDFPYCSRCVGHAREWTAAWRAAAAMLAGGAIASVAAGVALGVLAGAGLATIAALAAVAAGLVLRRRARAACSPGCAGPGPAVTYRGWADQVQTFSFTSRLYAASFAEENERSLVNVTPHLYQLLEQHRVTLHPSPLAPARPQWTQRVDRSRARVLFDQVLRVDDVRKALDPRVIASRRAPARSSSQSG